MRTSRTPKTPLQALIRCIHVVQPPVFAEGVKIYADPNKRGDSVTVTYAMTPELVKAWGEACEKLNSPRVVEDAV